MTMPSPSSQGDIQPEALAKMPVQYAVHYRVVPVKFENNCLTVLMTDPNDMDTQDDLSRLLKCQIQPQGSSPEEIQYLIREYYGVGAEHFDETSTGDLSPAAVEMDSRTEKLDEISEDQAVKNYVNQILIKAYRDRATDLHLEPYESELKVRYRIDGILYAMSVPQAAHAYRNAIISRIKVMARLNIAEKRLPQDGRVKVRVDGVQFDMRVSILPTYFGESVVIRLLSTGTLLGMLGLKNLGFSEYHLEIIYQMIEKPHGIIFVTGPTGSGKTTTLYSCLNHINKTERKIITLEDPIEYLISGITQVQVYPKIGLDFAAGLRSMLRHDPDVMMIGEVRDLETVETTIRLALTGHLAFTTLHTNDAASTIARLLDMGVEPFLIASSVECIIAQRLVRLICEDCKVKGRPLDKKLIERLGFNAKEAKIEHFEGKGCQRCQRSGYFDRTAIYEILVMTDEIRDLIVQRVSTEEIKKLAVEQGMQKLRQDGWEKVKAGRTTLTEVLRVA